MKKQDRKPNLLQAFIPVITMIGLLGVSNIWFDLRIEILLLITTLISGLLAVYLGYKWDEIIESINDKISKTLPALMILLMVGFLIGAWMIGGTIPFMVKLGLSIIHPKYIIVTSFIVAAIISICTGTSWGSVSTVGVALMSIAIGMDARLDMVAGAIVSGAYFGDKMSPLSDTTNLASIVAGSKLYEHIAHMLYTTGPSFILAGIVYIFLGLSMDTSTAVATVDSLQSIALMDEIYNLNWFMIIPVVIVIWGSISKKPTIPVMMISGVVAIINVIFIHCFSINIYCLSCFFHIF